jgi:hypothetical protein
VRTLHFFSASSPQVVSDANGTTYQAGIQVKTDNPLRRNVQLYNLFEVEAAITAGSGLIVFEPWKINVTLKPLDGPLWPEGALGALGEVLKIADEIRQDSEYSLMIGPPGFFEGERRLVWNGVRQTIVVHPIAAPVDSNDDPIYGVF